MLGSCSDEFKVTGAISASACQALAALALLASAVCRLEGRCALAAWSLAGDLARAVNVRGEVENRSPFCNTQHRQGPGRRGRACWKSASDLGRIDGEVGGT